MHEIILLIIVLLLALACVGIACYPLRNSKFWYALAPVVFLGLLLAYFIWGDYFFWHQYQDQLRKQVKVKTVLQSPEKTGALIEKIRRQLNQAPENAQGWYLLGKLYLIQKDYENARNAFAKAYGLNPKDEQTALFYVQTLWELNHQTFDSQMRGILQKVIKQNSKQPDALAMLAMDAYQQKNYSEAIKFWQQLLVVIPRDSKEGQAILQAIERAQRQLQN